MQKQHTITRMLLLLYLPKSAVSMDTINCPCAIGTRAIIMGEYVSSSSKCSYLTRITETLPLPVTKSTVFPYASWSFTFFTFSALSIVTILVSAEIL